MKVVSHDVKGFTLLELLVVVVILGGLVALAIPAYTTTVEKAKKQEAYQALLAVRHSQQRYYNANKDYAGTFVELDFDPTTTMPGQTAIFTYTLDPGDHAYRVYATRTGNDGGPGGNYVLTLSTDGDIVSNF